MHTRSLCIDKKFPKSPTLVDSLFSNIILLHLFDTGDRWQHVSPDLKFLQVESGESGLVTITNDHQLLNRKDNR